MRIKTLIILAVLISCAATVYAVKWYRGFFHHVTREELSHTVKHSSFQVTVRSGSSPLDLQLYQQEHAGNQPLVLFTSGDGGWSPFCADVAAHIAATGITVVGIDVKSYLVSFASRRKPLSPEDLARDYDVIARQSITQAGIDGKAPLILAGWSLGASYSVVAATEPEFSLPVSRIIAISPPMYGELAWSATDAIIYFTHGTPHERSFETQQYLKKLRQTPIVFVNATSDKTTPLREAQSLYEAAPGAKRFYAVKATGHHFEGGEKEFYEDLDLGLSLQQIADKRDKKLQETGTRPGLVSSLLVETFFIHTGLII